MSVVAKLTRGNGKAFDKLRKVYLGPNAQARFLRADHSTLITLTEAWAKDFDSRDRLPLFLVARTDEAFSDVVAEAAFIVVLNSTNLALNNQLHSIDRDTDGPALIGDHWEIGAAAKGERYQA